MGIGLHSDNWRARGGLVAVTNIDITDPLRPRFLCHVPTAGNLSTRVVHKDALIIPGGHNGLLAYDDLANAHKLRVAR